uniref:Uncharacterized protein n=1 Tax=Oryza meridionalis TaxID=40149 RepID=A0A0E0CNB7_9ORYZ
MKLQSAEAANDDDTEMAAPATVTVEHQPSGRHLSSGLQLQLVFLRFNRDLHGNPLLSPVSPHKICDSTTNLELCRLSGDSRRG